MFADVDLPFPLCRSGQEDDGMAIQGGNYLRR